MAEISERLQITHYNASKHLRILREAGLVSSTKRAQQRLYTLAKNFRHRLARSSNVLDLGCCRFDFDRLPKVGGLTFQFHHSQIPNGSIARGFLVPAAS